MTWYPYPEFLLHVTLAHHGNIKITSILITCTLRCKADNPLCKPIYGIHQTCIPPGLYTMLMIRVLLFTFIMVFLQLGSVCGHICTKTIVSGYFVFISWIYLLGNYLSSYVNANIYTITISMFTYF